jgi:uncharacterized protein with HEPN domain
MRSEAERSALNDMLHNILLAQHFTEGQDVKSFRDDLMRIYAVTRCLEIISEASRRFSSALKARHPDIPWREIAGAGNVYRHDYEDVAANRVWDTVQTALPTFRAVVEQELAKRS